jgi:tRNA dimethylallyltransferase
MIGAEIVSVDSMQVYRGLDIGTAKPTRSEQAEIRHHLIDLVEPEEEFSVARFQQEARRVVAAATTTPLLLVGGSGLHFRAVVDPLEFEPTEAEVRSAVEALDDDQLRDELRRADPDLERVLDIHNRRRLVRSVEILRLTGRTPSARAASPARAAIEGYRALLPVRVAGIDPGAELAERVAGRVERMWEAGLVAEVEGLRDRLGNTAAGAVGYRQVLGLLAGETGLEETRAGVVTATLQLARRQRTWFRRDPRVVWQPWSNEVTLAGAILEEWGL